VAERLMYWPSVPALLAVAVGVVGFWRKYCGPGQPLARRAALLRTVGVLLIVALGVRSVVRNSDWNSDEQLFATDLRTYPNNAHLSNALAQILLWRAQQTPEGAQREELITHAERLLTRALEIESRFPHALRQLGLVYLLRGEQERALVYLNRALMLNPLDKQAQAYIARLRGDAATSAARVAELQREVERRPDDAALRLELSQLLIGLGRNYEALQQCTEAVRLAPQDVTALRTYGEALVLNLQEREALAVFRRVLTLDPADWETHANLSKLLADRDPAEALHHAQVAHDLRPNDLRTQINLAEAYALNGRTEDAIRQLRKTAQNLKPTDPFRQALTDRIAELEGKLP
jgi:Flp pilus assembly protein TadD